MKKLITCLFSLLFVHPAFLNSQSSLKFVIYDFDGLDIGQTDLPDGDYKNNDLSYAIAANPLTASEVLADRVLKLNLNWQTGNGEFGKEMAKFFELNSSTDNLNFYFYNPLSNSTNANITVAITEDDDNDNIYQYGSDDRWIDTVVVTGSSGWQLISLPLYSFYDSNSGGDGIFNAGFNFNKGKIFSIGFIFSRTNFNITSEEYLIDMISFSEGNLPVGNTALTLPPKEAGDNCTLGALTMQANPDSTPVEIESVFPNVKLKFVNWFLKYADYGTTPNKFPGNEVQELLDQHYRPIITWEMMYAQYARLDPVQPRLDKIINGYFDWYIDLFADKIKSYDDTVILRIFHEFDGNWYSWSLSENNNDANLYISAFRHVVDRFNWRGATKVQWMWCVNSDPKPYLAYNWIVNAYPGDNYVDIVATDIYNHPDLGVPAWKSFRYTLAESYYYLTKYFPNKPFYICEVGCRERYSGEDPTSQTKAEWLCEMSRELESYFCRNRALIFFSGIKEHDWRVNSSAAAQDALNNCIWSDNYYANVVYVNNENAGTSFHVYPNPVESELTIFTEQSFLLYSINELNIYDFTGKKVFSTTCGFIQGKIIIGFDLASGIYTVELKNNSYSEKLKIIKLV